MKEKVNVMEEKESKKKSYNDECYGKIKRKVKFGAYKCGVFLFFY